MKQTGRSVKNTAKNISLVALAALMGILSVANWLTGMNIEQMPSDNLLRRAHGKLFGGVSGYEIRASGVAAAEPAQLALSVDGTLYGVQYSPVEMDAAMETMRPVWAAALAGGELEKASEEELAAALRAGDCALIHYHGAIPLGTVAGWMGGKWEKDLAVETLVYTAATAQVFVRAGAGTLYVAEAQVDGGIFAAAQQGFRGLGCQFSGEAYAVYPETLLFENETLALPQLKLGAINLFDPQNGTGLERLLSAFGFTSSANYYLEKKEQMRVFVDDVSTLRVNAAGLVQYAAAGADSTVRAYDEGEASEWAALDAQLDCARLILDAATRAGETDTHASLYTVQQAGGRTTLVFLQTFGGVPVLGERDFATFVFDGGSLSSATIRLQRFEPEEVRQTVLPARQAAASAEGDARGLMVAYRSTEENRFVPGRFYI